MGLALPLQRKIYKQYGNESVNKVRENPFRLADDIWGIGFKTADGIAQKLGFGKEAFVRLRSGIMYTLSNLADQGHVYATKEQLIKTAKRASGSRGGLCCDDAGSDAGGSRSDLTESGNSERAAKT